MGVRFPSVVTNTVVATPVLTTAELLIATLPPLNLPLDFATVLILWDVLLNVGAAGSAITIRIRRGTTLAGALVQGAAGSDNIITAAQVRRAGFYFDVPGAVGGQQYSLTAQIANATGNTPVNDVAMLAFVL